MFFVVWSNDSFNFSLGWIKYIVIWTGMLAGICGQWAKLQDWKSRGQGSTPGCGKMKDCFLLLLLLLVVLCVCVCVGVCVCVCVWCACVCVCVFLVCVFFLFFFKFILGGGGYCLFFHFFHVNDCVAASVIKIAGHVKDINNSGALGLKWTLDAYIWYLSFSKN